MSNGCCGRTGAGPLRSVLRRAGMEEEASSDSLATSEEYELVCADQPRLSIAGNGSQDQLQSRLTELLAEGATGRQAAPSEGPPPPAVR